MKYLGDFLAGASVVDYFNTSKPGGVPWTLAGTPAIAVYRDGNTAESVAGVALTVDHDGHTGKHLVVIDTSANTGFYQTGHQYTVTLTAGTVDGTDVTGTILLSFSIENRNNQTDVRKFGGANGTFAGGRPETNATHWGGTAVGSAYVRANLLQILGTTLTETVGGYIAAAFKKFFDVSAPQLTAASKDQSGDTYADTQTLLGRITAARAGHWDNLDVGGPVASQADILAINQSASKHLLLQTVGQYERPESGSTTYTIEMRTFAASTGAAIDADSTPTLTAIGGISGSLAANLGAATNPATGVYRWAYTTASNATIEPVRFDGAATIGGVQRDLSVHSQVTDFVSSTWTTADRAMLTAAYNKLPSKSYLTGSNNSDGDVQLDEATGTPADSAGVTSLLARLGAFTGSGVNTVLGFFKALAGKTASTPSDLGGTFDATTDSQEAIRNNMGTPQTGDNFPRLGPPAGANLAADVAVVYSKVAPLPSSPAAVGSAMTLSSSGLDAVLLEAGITAGVNLVNDSGTQLTTINARQGLAAMLSALAAVLSGAGGATITIRPAGKPGGSPRITATVDEGNRTAILLRVPD